MGSTLPRYVNPMLTDQARQQEYTRCRTKTVTSLLVSRCNNLERPEPDLRLYSRPQFRVRAQLSRKVSKAPSSRRQRLLMMYPPSAPISLPSSYENLFNIEHIRVSHVPASAPQVTPVIQITLDRPRNNNAFTGQMMESLVYVYKLINADDRVRVVVLTGGGRMFCAGADLDIGFAKSNGETPGRDVDHRDGGGRVALAIHQCSKPTIAAIQGSAVGVGITMTLPAAIRVACSKAKIGFVFSRRGIIMEACSSYFLPRLIGHSRALHVVTTGSVYQADHPLLNDLFSEILPTPEATLARALELADEVAKNTSTVSSKLMRDLMYRGPDSAEATHLLDSRIIHGLFGSKDNEEGVKSFFEKRSPVFRGSVPKDVPGVWPWWDAVDIGYKETVSKGGSKL